MGEVVQESVNSTTTPLAPQTPVKLLGTILPRLLEFMHQVPEEEEILLSKIDLSDGFWRMIVSGEDRWNFCYVMPDQPGERTRIVVPSALQMGWMESPAYFCSATETGRDIAQLLVDHGAELSPHPAESFMTPDRPAKRRRTGETDYYAINVYVDDYILAAVESPEGDLLRRVSRATLHAIHSIFPPPDVLEHEGGKDSISRRKLERGDARWEPEKVVLGFLCNGRDRTIRLPEAKAAAVVKELATVLRQRKVRLKRFQKLVGKLRHAALILPAAKGLFTPINLAMRGASVDVAIGKDCEVRRNLQELGALIADLAKRPTHVDELVPRTPDFVGYCDACATGAGGVWFGGNIGLEPLVWRVHFPPDIANAVVSETNPDGSVTNSDLELAGVVLRHIALKTHTCVAHKQLGAYCDNSPTVVWVDRMASRATSPITGRLIRGLAMCQRATRSAPMTVTSIAGEDNTMADVASRSFFCNQFPQLDDSLFLHEFAAQFPLPKPLSLKIVHPTRRLISHVLSTLRGKRLPMQQWMTPVGCGTGRHGASTAATAAGTRTCAASSSPSNRNCSSLLLSGSGKVTSAGGGGSGRKMSRQGCDMSPRPTFWPDTPTPVGRTE